MPNGDLRDQVEELETRIDALSEIGEGCKKWILLSKVAMASGGIWLSASAIGLVRSELSTTVLAITAALAGVVWGGSNFSTLRRTSEAIKAAEALRSQIIDCADLPSFRGTRERKHLE